ncbi:hypothetical protein [Candidatus Protochlamydia phocaeensis]|uniref:hypothetical protein n=1 Tax=Candidatus Protochlamydia phocaeensis TaxID=1414722 RepID=UPI0012ABEC0A|nr:hypothetical protein [Candidatus Protochlamydia phocaeensis]
MNISVDVLRGSLSDYYETILRCIGQLANHTVKWLNIASGYLQDKRLAAATVIVANFAFCEIAVAVAKLYAKCLDHFTVPMSSLPEGPVRSFRIVQLFGVFSATVVGCNYAFYRGFNLSLAPLIMTALSIGSCAAYLFFRTGYLSNY